MHVEELVHANMTEVAFKESSPPKADTQGHSLMHVRFESHDDTKVILAVLLLRG